MDPDLSADFCKQPLIKVLKGHIMVYTVTWTAKAKNNNSHGSVDFLTLSDAMDFMVLLNADAKVDITWQEAV
jgi:hypothetical protein